VVSVKTYKDFDLFSRALFGSNDIDPDYIVMKELHKFFDFNPFWYTFLYLNYYDIYSGLNLLSFFPEPDSWNPIDFKKVSEQYKFSFCRERKGNARKIEVQTRAISEFLSFYHSPEFVESQKDAERMRRNIMKIYNQGAMIGYKYIEVLQKSFGFDSMVPPDMNMKNYSNKIDSTLGAFGVKYLYGLDNVYSKDFIPHWENVAQKLAKSYGVDVGAVETCFCKFAKLNKGRYYIGYDIYEHFQLEEVIGESEYKNIMSKHFDDRFWVKPKIYKELLPAYKQTGEVVWAKEFLGNYPSVNVLEIILNTE
jgi:hypothetical protein